MIVRSMARRATRTKTITRYRSRGRKYARRGARGIKKGFAMFRTGKINDVGAGVGGGIIAGAVASRVSPNPTVGTVAGLGGAYLWGGMYGLAGYALLRFFTGGLSLGGTTISAGSVSGAISGPVGSAVQVLQ